MSDEMGRFDIQWVGHCTKDGSNKIWGWLYYRDPTNTSGKRPSKCYTFWGAVGKTPQFKEFVDDYATTGWDSLTYEMKELVRKKVDRDYDKISTGTLMKLFPNAFDKFEDKFIFNMLAESFK